MDRNLKGKAAQPKRRRYGFSEYRLRWWYPDTGTSERLTAEDAAVLDLSEAYEAGRLAEEALWGTEYGKKKRRQARDIRPKAIAGDQARENRKKKTQKHGKGIDVKRYPAFKHVRPNKVTPKLKIFGDIRLW